MTSELPAVASVLRAIADLAGSGALGRRCADIERNQRHDTAANLRDPEIRWEVFAGMPGTAGAGASVTLLARLVDGRRVMWTIEVWIDTWGTDGPWTAVVKGDVDRDLTPEPFAGEECLFLEQRTVHEVEGIGAAVHEMGALVAAQPVE